jgi:hypothetical protein
MLDEVNQLNESLTDKQRETLKSLLDEDIYAALETALESESEGEAKLHVASLREKLSDLSAFDLFQIGMALDADQKTLIGTIANF